MTTKTTTARQIGEIAIDSGLCWIGDPSYVLHPKSKPKAIGKDWRDFCSNLRQAPDPSYVQFADDLGRPELGVAVTTGFGDGLYPVYAQFTENGRVAAVVIEFIRIDDDTSQAESSNAKIDAFLEYLDKNYILLQEFGCYAAITEDKTTIFDCPIQRDGTPERDDDNPRHLNWTEVAFPEPGFLERVNEIFGTSFNCESFRS